MTSAAILNPTTLDLPYSGVFVDGQWRESSSTDVHALVNPYTEQPWATAMIAKSEDVDLAVRSAHAALHGEWAQFDLEARIAVVQRIRDLIAERTEAFALAHVRSMGALYAEALFLSGALQLIDAYIDDARKVAFDVFRSDQFGSSLVSRRPVGVVAGITPWNAALREVKKAIPALLSGCTVVLKPAVETPFGAAMFAEICTEAGTPPGVVNMVHGGATTGDALVRHELVRKIAFTGSSTTGAAIAGIAAPQMKRLSLELGGKSAAIVLEDADVTTTIPALVAGAWSNGGQVCTSTSRILVHRSRYDDVVDALVTHASAQVLGDPMDPTTTIQPLVSRRQYEKVNDYIGIGIQEGARLVAGGGRPDDISSGYFVAPTVFADVDNTMRVAREEIFGPVTCVIPFDSDEQAIAIANDSEFGLGGGVYGADDERGLRIARQIDSGTVGINRYGGQPTAPFGGVKMSGIGREHGPEGFDSFLEYTSYHLSPSLADTLTSRYPHG